MWGQADPTMAACRRWGRETGGDRGGLGTGLRLRRPAISAALEVA